MTNQKDPGSKPTPRGSYVRHPDGSWNLPPLVLGALAIVVVGYMVLGDHTNTAPSSTIEQPVPKTN